MKRAAAIMLAACTPAAAPVIAQHVAPPAATPLERQILVDRGLAVGPGLLTRGRLELTIRGDVATLVETDEEAVGPMTLAEADRRAQWKVTDTKTKTGPFHHVGDHVALDMESPNDALDLRCWQKTIVVATAGAIRVPTPGIHPDCTDPGAWSPPTMVKIEAWICGQGEGLDDGQKLGIDGQLGSIDETLFRFAPAPGIEEVEVNDDCFESKGLRLAK